jgi:uncharacterized protein YndB with AHSA1/START domain
MMTERSVTHATFVIERTYPVAPARVFAAWASQDAKANWFAGSGEWEASERTLDFRVGGRETLSGASPGKVKHHYNAVYHDIVPEARIILSYDMHIGAQRISVSLATVEFKPAAKGTRLLYTEQGAYLDGYDDAGQREHGTRVLLDNLAKALESA